MTDDEVALLRTIRDHPDADLPRLVYADWLDDRGDEDRAEFIRLQIDRYRSSAIDPAARRGIGWREYEILLKHELAWKAELPPGFRTGAAFRRGLIHRASCRGRDLFSVTARTMVAPIEVLSVLVDELSLEWLLKKPDGLWHPLAEVSFTCTAPAGPILADRLAVFGPFPRLHTLRIHDRHFGNAGVAALAPLPTFPAVRHLDLSDCGLTDGFAAVILDSGWLDCLERLTISGNAFTSDVRDQLRERHPNLGVG